MKRTTSFPGVYAKRHIRRCMCSLTPLTHNCQQVMMWPAKWTCQTVEGGMHLISSPAVPAAWLSPPMNRITSMTTCWNLLIRLSTYTGLVAQQRFSVCDDGCCSCCFLSSATSVQSVFSAASLIMKWRSQLLSVQIESHLSPRICHSRPGSEISRELIFLK